MTTQETVDTELDIKAEESTKESETLKTEEVLDLATLQAQLSDRDAQIAKLENDLKSRDGQRRKASETDAILIDLQAEAKAQRKVLSLYLDTLQSGDTEGLAEKRAGVDRESAQERATRQFQTRYDLASEKLMGVVNDDTGQLLLTDEQAAGVQEAWKKAGAEASRSGDFSLLNDVILDAAKMVTKTMLSKEKAETQRIREEEKAKTKQRLERAGVIDLDTGPSAGASGIGMSWAQAQKIKKVSDLSDKDYEKLVAGG